MVLIAQFLWGWGCVSFLTHADGQCSVYGGLTEKKTQIKPEKKHKNNTQHKRKLTKQNKEINHLQINGLHVTMTPLPPIGLPPPTWDMSLVLFIHHGATSISVTSWDWGKCKGTAGQL